MAILGWLYTKNKPDNDWALTLSSLGLFSLALWAGHGIVFEADYWKAPILAVGVSIIGAVKYYVLNETNLLPAISMLFGMLALMWILHGVVQENELWKMPLVVPAAGAVYYLQHYVNNGKAIPSSAASRQVSPRANDPTQAITPCRSNNVSPRHPSAIASAV